MLLENNLGDSISAISHFEESIAYGEMMTSNSANEPVKLSMFTLKLLESTGWYIPDYFVAEPYTFGKFLGCNFVYGINNKIRKEMTCTDQYDIGCSIDGLGWGQSLIDPLMDNMWHYRNSISCEVNWWKEIKLRESRFADKGYYGEGSRCFHINSERDKRPFPLCLKTECIKSDDSWVLQLSQGEDRALCERKSTISFRGVNLFCPDPQR